MLAGLFVTTAVIGLFVSNTATAVLMAPVAIATAAHLGASPYPFAMIVALAASSAFMTPVSSPVNLLVLGPGRYRFADFLKVGTPFTLVVLIVSVFMVPWLLPVYPARSGGDIHRLHPSSSAVPSTTCQRASPSGTSLPMIFSPSRSAAKWIGPGVPPTMPSPVENVGGCS